MHLQNAGRQWNFSSSNVAGSVWGWTVNKLTYSAYSTLHFQFSISTGRTFFKSHALRKCRPLAARHIVSCYPRLLRPCIFGHKNLRYITWAIQVAQWLDRRAIGANNFKTFTILVAFFSKLPSV